MKYITKMGFNFSKPTEIKGINPTTVTIPLEEYNELKLAMQFIEDNNFTMQFLMYQGLLNPPQNNLDEPKDDMIFIDSD